MRISDGEPVEFALSQSAARFENGGPIHAGTLATAQDIFGVLSHDWILRFFELYQKGGTLLAFPQLLTANFYDEALLSYYRCLEYVTMDRILQESGQFDEKRFQRACSKIDLHLVPSADRSSEYQLREMCKCFIRLRGSAAAHLGKGRSARLVNDKDIHNLKLILDQVVTRFAFASLAAAALLRNGTDDSSHSELNASS